MRHAPAEIPSALKKHFGYDHFRPLQREIIADALSGRDVFALLPTGGGKSLCFQLPALLRDGVTIVVSPLIALMKDQVDALLTSGVAATFLNSTLAGSEARERLRGLDRNQFRLLYVAPERLMMENFLERALNWSIAQIAIDEAHCISEWGHDFRPEYRELKKLRTLFPDVPIMALTATATKRVRDDIIKQLKLRDPHCYVASFNRPNLTYRVVAKSSAYQQVLDFIRARPNESGIVYCASRKSTNALSEKLTRDGIKALPYHAGMEPRERTRNQEAFLREDARVITATIAFGMGINKPNVRFVIHHDLPKNIEGYYQETGRAGRDGLPSECVLLFSVGDVVKQRRFIEEKSESEQQIAHEQLRTMIAYAETRHCRRATLLRYFGESWPPASIDADSPPDESVQPADVSPASARRRAGDSAAVTGGEISCNGCDNCLEPRETFDGTIAAQKFLSCVHRVQAKQGFGFGLNHIVEVLIGGTNDAIKKRGHDQLSTFGIGADLKREQWQRIGRELLRLGLVEVAPGKFATLSVTESGMMALRKRTPITLTKPIEAPAKKVRFPRAGEIECDEDLFERLRALRRKIADERDVPAYIIFSDATLREMARACPQSKSEFAQIAGVGQQKLKEFAEPFLAEISDHLRADLATTSSR
jgi:ATP-dependent DNA helicase RecQ